MAIIWQGTKVVLFCGTAYTLVKADVWGDNRTTIDYINSKCDSSDRIKYYKMMIPSAEALRIQWADSWNNGVRSVFSFVDELPQHSVSAASWVSSKVQQLGAVQDVPKTEIAQSQPASEAPKEK